MIQLLVEMWVPEVFGLFVTFYLKLEGSVSSVRYCVYIIMQDFRFMWEKLPMMHENVSVV